MVGAWGRRLGPHARLDSLHCHLRRRAPGRFQKPRLAELQHLKPARVVHLHQEDPFLDVHQPRVLARPSPAIFGHSLKRGS